MYKIWLLMIALILITSCASQNTNKSFDMTQTTQNSEKPAHKDESYSPSVIDNISLGAGMTMFVIGATLATPGFINYMIVTEKDHGLKTEHSKVFKYSMAPLLIITGPLFAVGMMFWIPVFSFANIQ